MNKTATVEKTDDGGYIISFPEGVKRVATDERMLAEKFQEWPEKKHPLVGGGDIPAIWPLIESLEEAGVLKRGDDPALTPNPSPDSAALGEGSTETGDEWPSTVPPRIPEVSPDEPVRAAVADDGYEYPPVVQKGPNHFVITCPTHGETRMERQGSSWACTGKTNKQACIQVIPREVVGRLVKAAS